MIAEAEKSQVPQSTSWRHRRPKHIVPVWVKRHVDQRCGWCKFQSEFESKGRRKRMSQLKDRWRERESFLTLLSLFYSGLLLYSVYGFLKFITPKTEFLIFPILRKIRSSQGSSFGPALWVWVPATPLPSSICGQFIYHFWSTISTSVSEDRNNSYPVGFFWGLRELTHGGCFRHFLA